MCVDAANESVCGAVTGTSLADCFRQPLQRECVRARVCVFSALTFTHFCGGSVCVCVCV